MQIEFKLSANARRVDVSTADSASLLEMCCNYLKGSRGQQSGNRAWTQTHRKGTETIWQLAINVLSQLGLQPPKSKIFSLHSSALALIRYTCLSSQANVRLSAASGGHEAHRQRQNLLS